MTSIDIRDAAPHDVARLRVIYRRASWSNEMDRPLLAEHPEFLLLTDDAVLAGRTRVARIDGVVAGFASATRHGDTLELDDLFVDPEWMRRGVAAALVADVVARAERDGVREIGVDGNRHALAFYRSVGFAARDEVALAHGTTAVRMVRTLAER